MEHGIPDPVRARRSRPRRILITGAGGQLGTALQETFAEDDVVALTHRDWDVREPPPPGLDGLDLVLHAAAWTDVDGAEAEPEAAHEVNVVGTRNAASLGVPLVYFSTDYVFDGEKAEPYVESDEPRPLSAYGRSKLAGEREVGDGWIVRSSWLFGPTGRNFVRTMLAVAGEREEVAVVDDQRGSPTYVGHLADAVTQLVALPHGTWHVAASGDCTWLEFADAIFRHAGLETRARPVSTAELARPASRPAYSVLRSERPNAPQLPHWREGLRACFERLAAE